VSARGGFDAVVIGAGANGLTAATCLARAGLKVALLERTAQVGGQGALLEFAPGYRAAPLGVDPGWLSPATARALGMAPLETSTAEAPLSVALPSGGFLTIPRSAARAAEAIRAHSAADAAAWPAFVERLRALAGFLEVLYQHPAPDIHSRSLSDLLPLLEIGPKFRALGRANMIEFLRTLPLSVWELLDDWFESPSVKAAVAPGGIQDYQQGPRSGGTGFVLLHHLVGAPAGSVRGRLPWRQGPDAFTAAAEAAARRAGVILRTSAAVARIVVKDDAVSGVVLSGGEEIAAPNVIATGDPASTLLGLVDPVWLDPEFLLAVRNIRHRGCTAIVLYALDRLPEATGAGPGAWAGTLSLTPSVVALEQAADAAKYGTVSTAPHIELTAPTFLWPDLAPSGKQVVVARVQYAPYHLSGGGMWSPDRRDRLAETVTASIERAVPGFAASVLHRVALSPHDLEERFGVHRGAATQGELGLDQILFMRPVPGWANHTTPIEGLFLGGAGTHPGPGILGGPGTLSARRVLDRKRRGSR
jgi:phytoene dehydrogenase-like protein